MEKLPVLYILMRDDLDSLNSGKGMAQASHASNAFVHAVDSNNEDYKRWAGCTEQGFGTVLVLAVDENKMRTAVDVASKLDFLSGVVHDPTYPILDGEVVHYIPIDTCAYVFVPDKDDPMAKAVLGRFSLHP